jgi:small nuclear ribonucleoprotein
MMLVVGVRKMQNIMEKNLDREILVVLRWGISIRGVLKAVDAQMNALIEKADEIVNDEVRPLGTILIRGDNIIMVTAS